jgi:cation diffusion facilitator CzcD-associated flavoprotein CzcO
MSGTVDAVIIGAGPAGLASAACRGRRGLEAVIFEKSGAVAAVWRRHYDRLQLHTPRRHSALPGLPMPATYGRYPSRAQAIEYFESYASRFGLKPRFNACVEEIQRDGAGWRVRVDAALWRARNVIVATGWADYPHAPTWPAMERLVPFDTAAESCSRAIARVITRI